MLAPKTWHRSPKSYLDKLEQAVSAQFHSLTHTRILIQTFQNNDLIGTCSPAFACCCLKLHQSGRIVAAGGKGGRGSSISLMSPPFAPLPSEPISSRIGRKANQTAHKHLGASTSCHRRTNTAPTTHTSQLPLILFLS